MAYLTKTQIKDIIDNRPKDTTPEQVITGLVQRGHQLEGYQESNKSADVSAPEPKKSLLSKTAGVLGKIFPGQKIGEAIGTGIAKLSVPKEQRSLVSKGPSGKEVAADVGKVALTAAFGAKPSPSMLGRLAFGPGAGAAAGTVKGLEENKDIAGIAGDTLKGAAIGLGTAGIFESVGMALKSFAQKKPVNKLVGNIYNKALQTPSKELDRQLEFNLKTTGEKVAEAGYSGGLKSMKKQAEQRLIKSGVGLNTLLSEFPQVKVSKPQVIGSIVDKLQDVFGALDKNQIKTIKLETSKIPDLMDLKSTLKLKRTTDKKIDPTFWVEPNERKAFIGWVRYILRGNMKTAIEKSTNSQAVKKLNEEMSLAMDVRHLSALQQRIRIKGQSTIPLGRYSLFADALNRTVFNPAITTKLGQGLRTLGRKTGQSQLRQAGRLGVIEGSQK